MNKLSVESRLKAVLRSSTTGTLSIWDAVDKIWDGCMQQATPGNGARVSHVIRATRESKDLVYFIDSAGVNYVSIKLN